MTGLPHELERLGQALALIEGFQIVLLECHGLGSWDLHRLFDLIQARVAELRGVPPLVVVYDPHVTTSEEGSLRDEAWVEGVLGPILRLPAPTAEGASVIAVIDGTGSASASADELTSWTFLFHRMNERRNQIARTLVGTLVLALMPRLVGLFLSEASDSASIRSGMFRVDRGLVPGTPPSPLPPLDTAYPAQTVHEAHVRRAVADPAMDPAVRSELRTGLAPRAELRDNQAPGRYWALENLLLSIFSVDELRRFLRYLPSGGLIFDEIPQPTTAPAILAHEAVQALERHGLLDTPDLWAALRSERPRRYAEIDRVAAQFEGTRPRRDSRERASARVLYINLRGDPRFVRARILPSVIRGALVGGSSDHQILFESLYATSFATLRMVSLHPDRLRVLVIDMQIDDEVEAWSDHWVRLTNFLAFSLPHGLLLLIVVAPLAQDRASRLASAVDLVIGIDSAALPERDVVEFMRLFFEELARGESVEVAFELGLAAVDVDSTAGRVPVLLPAQADDVRQARGRSLV